MCTLEYKSELLFNFSLLYNLFYNVYYNQKDWLVSCIHISVEAVFNTINPLFESIRQGMTNLATKIPPNQYYR